MHSLCPYPGRASNRSEISKLPLGQGFQMSNAVCGSVRMRGSRSSSERSNFCSLRSSGIAPASHLETVPAPGDPHFTTAAPLIVTEIIAGTVPGAESQRTISLVICPQERIVSVSRAHTSYGRGRRFDRATATLSTPPWLASGWGRRGRRLSRGWRSCRVMVRNSLQNGDASLQPFDKIQIVQLSVEAIGVAFSISR
jgi:hypothetical protein